ncbi:MAG: cupin domain-containing protein [Dehalococcoidia bacterium]|nr:cupin domain-containing protein [Dehalococcoidia bacterium]
MECDRLDAEAAVPVLVQVSSGQTLPIGGMSWSGSAVPVMPNSPKKQVRVMRPDQLEVVISSGAMTRLAGVSKTLTGSEGIHMAVATIPPGRCSTAHYHTNCESAIYVAAGRGLFLSGDRLEREDEIGPGDFIYVPSEANHQPVNTSKTEPLVLIVARNTPVELVVELESLGRQDC